MYIVYPLALRLARSNAALRASYLAGKSEASTKSSNVLIHLCNGIGDSPSIAKNTGLNKDDIDILTIVTGTVTQLLHVVVAILSFHII